MDACKRNIFTEELEAHYDYVFGVAFKRVKSEDRAQDLMQASIMKAWENFDKFEVGTNFRAWLCRIMINTHINGYRKQKMFFERAVQRPDRVENWFMSDPPESQHRMYEINEEIDERILAALNEMGDEWRETLLLREVDGLKYKEIAEIMDCPVGTVMSRLYRARREAKDLIEKTIDPYELMA